jgi:hypothetical protein
MQNDTVEVWVNGRLRGTFDDFQEAEERMESLLEDARELRLAEGRDTMAHPQPSKEYLRTLKKPR